MPIKTRTLSNLAQNRTEETRLVTRPTEYNKYNKLTREKAER